MESIIKAKRFPEAPNLLIRQEYTGIAGFDLGLGFLVAAFLPSGVGFKPEHQVLLSYFLVSFFPFLAIFTIESGRRGMRNTWTYFTSIWALFYQTIAGAAILPLYFFFFMRDTSKIQNLSPSERQLDSNYAKAMIPALLIGYLLPTIAAFTPFPDPGLHLHQGIIGLWQFSPLIVNALLLVIRKAMDFTTPTSQKKRSDLQPRDSGYVKSLYSICMFTSAMAHFGMLYYCTLTPRGFSSTLCDAFVLQPDKFYSPLESDLLHHIFQVDLCGIGIAAFIWTLVAVYDTRLLGQSDVNILLNTIAALVGSVIVGPAAVMSYVWRWREDKIRMHGKVKKV